MKDKIKAILVCLITFMYTFGLNKCFAQNNNDVVVVGLDVEIPPIGFLNKKGEIVGFDVDLCRETFGVLGKKVRFQPINWDAKELELESGKIDVVWNGLTFTEERAKNMLLTKPYMKNKQIFMVKGSSKINNLSDLKNKTICVQKGAAVENELINSDIGKNAKSIVSVGSMADCINEVKFNRSDVAVIDDIMAKYYLKQNNMSQEFKILDEAFTEEYDVIAVKKGNEKLKNEIEKGLSEAVSSGKAKEISEKWFGEDVLFFKDDNTVSDMTFAGGAGNKDNILAGILNGVFVTLKLFFVCLLFSIPLGILLCFLRRFKIKILNALINVYVVIMRGTPLLLQIFFIFYGVPLLFPWFKISNRFFIGAVAFILNYAAYFSEIFRGGISSIPFGQWEAIKILKIPKVKAIKRIILPQALKACLPSVCNEVVTLVKDTSLIFSIGIVELLTATKNAVNVSANISIYGIAALIYLAICFVVNLIFKFLEEKVRYES